MNQSYWRKCIVCKNEINFSTKYYKCSVSSCDKKRAPAQFCTVDCWDVHRSIMSHKSAGADEYQSPSKAELIASESNGSKVRIIKPESSTSKSALSEANTEDVLIVVSKLKTYVKSRSDLSTAADVMPELSKIIRSECDKAIERARADGRKTLMARDF